LRALVVVTQSCYNFIAVGAAARGWHSCCEIGTTAKLKEDESMKQNIGFMGMGIMGVPMSASLLKAGFPVTVYNRSPERLQPLQEMGATRAATPYDLAASSDVIIAMVTGPDALQELLFGSDGAAGAFNDGKVFINMSSVSPLFTRELSDRLASTRVTFIDAPVSGTKKPAEDGTLVVLAGGPQDKVQELEPLFLAMGKKVVYCGPAGQGSMMKMFINLLLGLMMEGFAEALNFGRLGGLDMEAMLDTVYSGPLNCALFQMKAPLLQEGDYPPAFPLKHMAKDAKFVADMAHELGAPVPVGHAMLQMYRIGVARGWGDLDISAVAKVMEHLSAP
jgi:3-hydroxyisobutyrate dehydrogenase-like beta-hydroxyacid dehydrogenase